MSSVPLEPYKLSSRPVEIGTAGERIRGTLYSPSVKYPVPGVVLAHGWGMCAGGDLEEYAQAVARRGFAALTFDFRRLGKSEGLPRQEINPYDQIEDYRTAITWLSTQPGVRPRGLGVWGSSYSGGHVLVVAATDSRVGAVVAQVPTISGYSAALRKTHPDHLDELRERFHADRLARLEGSEPKIVQMVGPKGADVAYPGEDSYRYMTAQGAIVPEWRNEVTMRSLEIARAYEPGVWIERIGPTPLLMIAASKDTTTPIDMQLDAFASAREPKCLLLINGGHYSAYEQHFEETSEAAADWFVNHLIC